MEGSSESALQNSQMEELARNFRIVVNDPATLSKNLRLACVFLGSPAHAKADQVLGTIVALHASRMLTTVWTVLFLELREKTDIRAKLTLIRHFAHVSDRISPTERPNAFRVFCAESLAFLSEIQVIADARFCKSFRQVVSALGPYSVGDECVGLLRRIDDGMRGWTRPDVLRNAASMVTTLVCSSHRCGTIPELLLESWNNHSFATFLLLFDSCCDALLATDQTNTESTLATGLRESLLKFEESIIEKAFFPEGSIVFSNIPVVVTSYEKMSKITRRGGPTVGEEKLCSRVLYLLSCDDVKMVAKPSLLRFLEITTVSWWDEAKVVLSMCTDVDATIRFNAFSAIANSLHSAPISELTSILSTLLYRLDQCTSEGCSYTVCGIIKVLTVLFSNCFAVGIDCCSSIYRVFHNHCDCTKSVNNAPSVILLMLDIINLLPVISSRVVCYVLDKMMSQNKNVRKKAFESVMNLCVSVPLDKAFLGGCVLSHEEYLGNSFLSNMSPSRQRLSIVSVAQNTQLLLDYLAEQVSERFTESEKSRHETVQFACEGICHILQVFDSYFSSVKVNLLEGCLQSLYSAICDQLLSAEVFPTNVFVELVNACEVCLKKGALETSFDVFCHMRVLNFIFGVIHSCCISLDPISTAPQQNQMCLYFSRTELNCQLVNMIAMTADTALKNNESYDETDFYLFVESNLALLNQLILAGGTSPIFIEQLMVLYPTVLTDFNVLAGYHAATSVYMTQTLFTTLFSRSLVTMRHNHTKILFEAGHFGDLAVSIVRRSLTFSIESVIESICLFFESVVQFDTIQESLLYVDVVDKNFELLRRLLNIVTDKRAYLHQRGRRAIYCIIKYIVFLHQSVYREKLKLVITSEIITECIEALGVCASANPGKDAEKSRAELTSISEYYGSKRECQSEANWACLLASSWRCSSEYFECFEQICSTFKAHDSEAVDVLKRVRSCDVLGAVICGAALDYTIIPIAVKLALSTKQPPAPFLVQLLIVIMSECTATDLPPLKLLCFSEKEFIDDHTLLLIKSYRWGHLGCYNAHVEANMQHGLAPTVGDTTIVERRSDSQHICDKSGAVQSSLTDNMAEAAVTSLPFGLSSTECISGQLFSFQYFDKYATRHFLNHCDSNSAILYLEWVISHDAYHLLNVETLVNLSRVLCLYNGGDTVSPSADRIDADGIEKVLRRAATLLKENELGDSELLRTFRYSALLMTIWARDNGKMKWADVPERAEPISVDCLVGDESPESILGLLNGALQTAFTDCHQLARYIVSRGLQPQVLEETVEASLLWLAVCCIPHSVWQVIRGEEFGRISDAESIRFVCRWNQTIGLPLPMLEEVHVYLATLLLSFNGPGEASEVDTDCAALWLLSSVLLATTRSRTNTSRVMNPDCVGSTSAVASKIHRFMEDALLFPVCERKDVHEDQWRSSFLNRHAVRRLLPLPFHCAPRAQARIVTGSQVWDSGAQLLGIHTSCHHLLTKASQKVIGDFAAQSPFHISSLLSTLAVLSHPGLQALPVQCMAAVQTGPSPGSDSSTEALKVALQWTQLYATPLLDGADAGSSRSVWNEHIGHIPSPESPATVLYDSFNMVSAATILGCLHGSTTQQIPTHSGDARVSGAPGPGPLLEKMLCADMALYCGALGVVATMCADTSVMLGGGHGAAAAAAVRVTAGVAVARRFQTDLQGSQWGAQSSLLFVVRQLLRCTRNMVTVKTAGAEEEGVSMKLCEGVWHALNHSRWCRPLLRDGYRVLQSLVHSAPIGGPLWDLLSVLIKGGVQRPTNNGEDGGDGVRAQSGVWSRSLYYCPVEQSTLRELCDAHRLDVVKPTCMTTAVSEVYALQDLTTQALVVLRKVASVCVQASSPARMEVTLEGSRVEVLDLLSTGNSETRHFTATAASTRVLMLESLTSHLLPEEDAFFVALGAFRFTSAERRRAVVHALLRVLRKVGGHQIEQSGPAGATDRTGELSSWLSTFFEAAARQAEREQDCWWLACVVHVVLLDRLNTEVSETMATALALPQGREKSCALSQARWIACLPLRDACSELWQHVLPGLVPTTSPAKQCITLVADDLLTALQLSI